MAVTDRRIDIYIYIYITGRLLTQRAARSTSILDQQKQRKKRNKQQNSQFLLHDQAPGSDDLAVMLDDNQVIGALPLGIHLVVALVEVLLREVTDPGEHAQTVEKPLCEVCPLKRAHHVPLWERDFDFVRDEGVGEEAFLWR